MGELEGKGCSGVRFDKYSSTLDVPRTKIGCKDCSYLYRDKLPLYKR
jgi:hypothetical protein